MKPSFANVYDAIDAMIAKLGLKRGGSPIALASRLVLDDDGNVCQPLITKKTTINLADLQALGAVTSGDVTTDIVLPASSVVFFSTIKQSTSLAGGFASGTLTSDNTNVADGDTVTIDSKVYTFKTALTPSEGQVLIGGSADASLLNLIRAINHSGTPGTDYQCAAAHPSVSAATSVTAHAFKITALVAGTAGNSIASTETSAHLSFGGAVLSGGNTAITAVTAQLKTANNNYGAALDVYQAVADAALSSMTTAPKSENFSTTTPVKVGITLTGDVATALTAGRIDLWVHYKVRP